MADDGRRNVGNRKERLRDYASSPEMSKSPEGGEGSELSAPSGRNSEAEHRKLKGVLARLFSFPGCPPIRPLGPAQRVPAGETTEKKEARKTFVLQTYTGKTVALRTPCFPSNSCFLRFAQRRRWAAAQTRLRDFIPQTPIFASRA